MPIVFGLNAKYLNIIAIYTAKKNNSLEQPIKQLIIHVILNFQNSLNISYIIILTDLSFMIFAPTIINYVKMLNGWMINIINIWTIGWFW